MTMKKERKQSFETYNHRILWGAAEKNLGLAVPSNENAKYFALGAMFLFFSAFEGYLNWLGTRIAPEVWEDERQFFFALSLSGNSRKVPILEQKSPPAKP
jgi:hypothetical protein